MNITESQDYGQILRHFSRHFNRAKAKIIIIKKSQDFIKKNYITEVEILPQNSSATVVLFSENFLKIDKNIKAVAQIIRKMNIEFSKWKENSFSYNEMYDNLHVTVKNLIESLIDESNDLNVFNYHIALLPINQFEFNKRLKKITSDAA